LGYDIWPKEIYPSAFFIPVADDESSIKCRLKHLSEIYILGFIKTFKPRTIHLLGESCIIDNNGA